MKSRKKGKKSHWEVQIAFTSEVSALSSDGKAKIFKELVRISRTCLGKVIGMSDMWSGLLIPGNRVTFLLTAKKDAESLAQFCKSIPETLDIFAAGVPVEE